MYRGGERERVTEKRRLFVFLNSAQNLAIKNGYTLRSTQIRSPIEIMIVIKTGKGSFIYQLTLNRVGGTRKFCHYSVC